MRQQRRRWSASYRQRHPERYREIQRRAWRAYWERIQDDPIRRQQLREDRRIDYRLRRERAGVPLTPAKKWQRHYEYLDPAPLLAMVDRLEINEERAPSLARIVRRLQSGESQRVEFGVVDALALHVGLLVHDLYPELAA